MSEEDHSPGEHEEPEEGSDQLDLNAIAKQVREGTYIVDQEKVDAITSNQRTPSEEETKELARIRDVVKKAREAQSNQNEQESS